MSDHFFKDSETKGVLREWLKTASVRYATRSAAKWNEEDSLTEVFLSAIESEPVRTNAGFFSLQSYKVRGRGGGARESVLGADGIGLVRVETSTTKVEGFFLFQAKKAKDGNTRLTGVVKQAGKMLQQTAASVVLILRPDEVVVTGAMAVASSTHGDPRLNQVPFTGFHLFVTEHLLRGMSLAPFNPALFAKQQPLHDELDHFFTIVAGEPDRERAAITRADSMLRELWDLERLPPLGREGR